MNLIPLIQEVIATLTQQGTPPSKLTVNIATYEALTREIVSYMETPPVMILCNLLGLTVTVDVESDTLMSFTL